MRSLRDRVIAPLGVAALLALFTAGLILAASWLVDFPDVVPAIAWLVAALAMITVAFAAIRESRRAGHGPFRAIGHMFGDLGRFVTAFF